MPVPSRPRPVLLLTGARAPATLELAQLLVDAGAVVHLADSVPWALGRGSTRAAAFHRLPSPRREAAACAAELRRVSRAHGVDAIVPTCEEVYHLAAVEARAPGACGAPVRAPAFAMLATLHDKDAFIRRAAAAGLPVPETHRVESCDALPPRASAPGAWVFKPVWSRFGTRVHRVAAGVPWPSLAPTPAAPWVRQRWVDGDAWCTWSVAHAGRLVVHTAYRVEATAGPVGAALAFRAERHAAIAAWVRTLVADLQLTGQIAFDFVDTADGPLPLECNPRLTSGVHTLRDDRRVAAALLRAVLGEEPRDDALVEPAPGRRFTSRLALLTYGHRVPAGLDLLAHPRDPWPARLQGVSWAWLLAAAARRRVDPRAWATDDIEWNGEPLS